MANKFSLLPKMPCWWFWQQHTKTHGPIWCIGCTQKHTLGLILCTSIIKRCTIAFYCCFFVLHLKICSSSAQLDVHHSIWLFHFVLHPICVLYYPIQFYTTVFFFFCKIQTEAKCLIYLCLWIEEFEQEILKTTEFLAKIDFVCLFNWDLGMVAAKYMHT